MNYSYVMGINNIDELKENNFQIKSFGNDYGVIFDDNKIELFERDLWAKKLYIDFIVLEE